MKTFQTKTKKLPGTNWREVSETAFALYRQIKRKTKRRPYVRSAYFKKERIFLEVFWHHLHEKENFRDKIRRMKFFPAAIELIKNSKIDPVSSDNPNRLGETLHRFTGVTHDSELFTVQIKEEKRNGTKWLMSVFPKK